MAGTWNVAGWQRASIPPRQAGSRRVLREPRANTTNARPWHAGRGHGGRTRARWQDAGTVAGRGHGGGTRARWQDADKQRPYYGRGLGAWGHVPRKSDGCPGRWRGHGTWPGGNAHPSHPGRPGHVVFYAKTYANTTNARPWHAGRGHVGGTRARWQDAGAVAGRGQAASLLWTGVGCVGTCSA